MNWLAKHWMLSLWVLSFIIGYFIDGNMDGAIYLGMISGLVLFIIFGLVSFVKDTNKLEKRMRAKRERRNRKKR